MLKNYLTIIWRQVRRQPLYPILNLSSLAISVAATLIILLYIQFELNYDRFHEKGDRIYRVTTPRIITHEKSMDVNWQGSHGLLGYYAQKDYPEVEAFTRFYQFFRGGAVHFDYEGFELEEENVFVVDSNTLDIFSFDLLIGDKETALDGPNKIIIAHSLAKRIFGDENPLGKSISCTLPHRYQNPQTDYALMVSGVFQDTPENTHLSTKAMISAATDPEFENYYFNDFTFSTYLLLKPEARPNLLATKLSRIYENYLDPDREPVMKSAEHALIPLWRIHMQTTQGMTYVYIFAGIALLLLLIAGISYVNMTTAQSSRRALEVGLRKLMGSTRKMLVGQFLTESILFTLIAVGIALVLVHYSIEPLNSAIGLKLNAQGMLKPFVLWGTLGIVFLLGILGGSYPAFFLSSFEPIAAIKGHLNKGRARHHLRKLLVAVQLAVVIFVLACTGMIYNQMEYVRQKDLGFNQDQVVMLQLPEETNHAAGIVLQEQLLQKSTIQAVTFSDFVPGVGGMIRGPIDVETENGHVQQFVQRASIDYNFFRTMDVELLEGRNFSLDFPGDSAHAVIVNQAFVDNFGLEAPLGKKIRFGGQGNPHFYSIIGVVDNFHQNSLHEPITSQLFRLRESSNIVIKIGDDLSSGMKDLENTWNRLYADAPFEYHFLDKMVQQEYEADQVRGTIFSFFSLLAIFVSFLGLFGLASFLAGQRIKEIGIRKVLGAGITDLVFLVSRDFVQMVFIAAIPACIFAWYIIQQWLENFAFRAQIHFGLFAMVFLLTLLLTFITTGGQAMRVANLNPADSLKSE